RCLFLWVAAFASFAPFPASARRSLIGIPEQITIGGWLGGALRWHFTFMWIFIASRLMYVTYQLATGHWRQVLFMPRDMKGVWPMARHYFLFGTQADRWRRLQSPAKARLHCHHFPRCGLDPDRPGALQADAVLVAGVADGRISSRPYLAFRGNVRIPGLYSRPPYHGCPARMEQLLFHGDGMEARSRILGVKL